MKVIIYQECGKIGQYHINPKEQWVIKFDNNDKFVNPTTGSIGGLTFNKSLYFNTQNAAIDYAKLQNFAYEIIEITEQKEFFLNSYAKNFI
jgi:hypothetical protein